MMEYPEINWDIVVNNFIVQYTKKLWIFRDFLGINDFSEKDINEYELAVRNSRLREIIGVYGGEKPFQREKDDRY
jgi:hypothetical protein